MEEGKLFQRGKNIEHDLPMLRPGEAPQGVISTSSNTPRGRGLSDGRPGAATAEAEVLRPANFHSPTRTNPMGEEEVVLAGKGN
jgi:hypothetical protein